MQVHQQPSPCSRSRTRPWWCCSWPRCTSRWTGSPAKTHCCQSHPSFASAVASCRSYYLNNNLVLYHIISTTTWWYIISAATLIVEGVSFLVFWSFQSYISSGWLNHFNHFNIASSSIHFSMNPIPVKFQGYRELLESSTVIFILTMIRIGWIWNWLKLHEKRWSNKKNSVFHDMLQHFLPTDSISSQAINLA